MRRIGDRGYHLGRPLELHPASCPKLLAKVLGLFALTHAAEPVGRGVFMMVPVLSIGVGAGLNYAFTMKVGRAATGALMLRRHSQVV